MAFLTHILFVPTCFCLCCTYRRHQTNKGDFECLAVEHGLHMPTSMKFSLSLIRRWRLIT